jgi:hypothetical protein
LACAERVEDDLLRSRKARSVVAGEGGEEGRGAEGDGREWRR